MTAAQAQQADRERAALQADVLQLMARWPSQQPAPAEVDNLLLQLFRWQARAIAPYAALLRRRGIEPHHVDSPDQIPVIPVSAFKRQPFCTAAAAQRPAVRFLTSGTSDGRPGEVLLADTALYAAALHATFAHYVMPDCATSARGGFRCLSLVPDAAARPHSSLGFMVRQLTARWDDGHGGGYLHDVGDRAVLSAAGGLDVRGFLAACEAAARTTTPVVLFTTTLAAALLTEHLPAGWAVQLPPGSRIMDTGGPKGRHLDISRADQHAALSQRLGVPRGLMVGELGMTELCSQRYEETVRAHLGVQPATHQGYFGPPWLRTRTVRLDGSGACLPGEQGLVAHLDLANLDTCAFILTADLGQLDPDGGLHLAGRVPGSEWRGCGLDAEALGIL